MFNVVPLWLVLPSVYDRFCLCGGIWLALVVSCVVLVSGFLGLVWWFGVI